MPKVHLFRVDTKVMREMFDEFRAFYGFKSVSHPVDFPLELTTYQWHIAYVGWMLMRLCAPNPVQGDGDRAMPAIEVPLGLKPMCDLDANHGFLVMVGTVAMLLDLTGFRQSGMEFLRRCHEAEYDTGQLFMLAYDYVVSVATLNTEANKHE